ncbi:MAG: fluoride efflux transporter CrcB [Phycisphaerales bacterium]
MMTKLLLIAAGGGAGSVLRYLVQGWTQGVAGPRFPVGTLVVNCTGCFAIGFLAMILTGPVVIRPEYRLAVLVGLLGGFTTYSAFGLETMALVGDRQWGLAVMNIALSNAGALAAVWAGHRVAEAWFGV